MNQKKRFCKQQGHQQNEVYHICTYRWCSKSRWCCFLCLSQKIHDHQISKNHIINLAEIPDKVKYDIEKLKKDYLNSEQGILIKNLLSQFVKEIQELEYNIVQFRQNLERQLNNLISDYDNRKLQSLLNQVEGQHFLKLNDEDINKLMKINEYRFLTNIELQLQDKLDSIKQQFNRVLQNLKDQQENINGMNYEIQKIQQLEKNGTNLIFSSTINTKEQYLVYNIDNLIHIYDIKMKRICKRIKQKNILFYFRFKTDYKYLFASNAYGFVYGFFVLNGFKAFYQQKIHQQQIVQIIIQKQYLITASNDKTIIKTDFIKKQQIFKLVGHNIAVHCIDYDISKDILISTSDDQTIKVWDCVNQSILIDYTINKHYRQIQFMNNNQDIICRSRTELWKFTIDYQNKQLVKLQFYHDENNILNFQQVNIDQILVICKQHCKILDIQGKLIYKIEYMIDLQEMFYLPYPQQLDNLNYIVCQDRKNIYLLEAQKQK